MSQDMSNLGKKEEKTWSAVSVCVLGVVNACALLIEEKILDRTSREWTATPVLEVCLAKFGENLLLDSFHPWEFLPLAACDSCLGLC